MNTERVFTTATFQFTKEDYFIINFFHRYIIILDALESDNRQQGIAGKPLAEVSENRGGMQLSFFQLDDPILCQIRDEILNLDVNNLTPIEALNKLNDIKKIVRGK